MRYSLANVATIALIGLSSTFFGVNGAPTCLSKARNPDRVGLQHCSPPLVANGPDHAIEPRQVPRRKSPSPQPGPVEYFSPGDTQRTNQRGNQRGGGDVPTAGSANPPIRTGNDPIKELETLGFKFDETGTRPKGKYYSVRNFKAGMNQVGVLVVDTKRNRIITEDINIDELHRERLGKDPNAVKVHQTDIQIYLWNKIEGQRPQDLEMVSFVRVVEPNTKKAMDKVVADRGLGSVTRDDAKNFQILYESTFGKNARDLGSMWMGKPGKDVDFFTIGADDNLDIKLKAKDA